MFAAEVARFVVVDGVLLQCGCVFAVFTIIVVTALTCSYEGPAHREKSTNSMSRAVIVITDSMERIQLPQPQSRFTSVPIVLS